MTDLNVKHLEDAMRRVKRLENGTLFTLNPHNKRYHSLFSAEDWAKLGEDVPVTTFGELFLKHIKDYNREHGLIAKILKKLSNNRQPYRKVGPPASE